MERRPGQGQVGVPCLARVRKGKNFPDSKIFHAKTFRIKRVICDTFAFATKVRKTGECHVFLPNVLKIGLGRV